MNTTLRWIAFFSLTICLAFGLASAAADAQTTHVVQANAISFSPSSITIKAGDTVRWIRNIGDHTVTEGTDGKVDGNEAFHSLLDAGTPVFQVTFDSAFLAANPMPNDTYDYFCVPHFFFGMKGKVIVQTPWTDLGFATPGSSGAPVLTGFGDLYPGTAGNLHLTNANSSSLSALFINFGGHTPVPFMAGTLAAFPITIQLILPTSGTGEILLPFAFPAGIPSGSPLVFQYAISDPGASAGVAISNAVRGVTP